MCCRGCTTYERWKWTSILDTAYASACRDKSYMDVVSDEVNGIGEGVQTDTLGHARPWGAWKAFTRRTLCTASTVHAASRLITHRVRSAWWPQRWAGLSTRAPQWLPHPSSVAFEGHAPSIRPQAKQIHRAALSRPRDYHYFHDASSPRES